MEHALEASMGIQSGSIRLALLAGLLLAVLYDLLRFLQVTVTGTLRHSILADTGFLLFCGVVTELLAIAAEFGRVRFYLVACEVIGVCAYQMTLGILTKRFALCLHRVLFRWRLLCGRVCRRLRQGIRKAVSVPVGSLWRRIRKKPQKIGKIP